MVVKDAPLVRLKVPLFADRSLRAGIDAPVPSRVTFASLVATLAAPGKDSVEPFSATQVPAVSVLPASCAIVAARLRLPEPASMVPVLLSAPLTRMVDVPVPAVLSMVPAFSISVSPPAGLSTPESDSIR